MPQPEPLPQPRKAMNRRNEKKAEVKRLLKHCQSDTGTHWMPFPADSVVPRVEGLGLSLLNPHLLAPTRARLALQTDFTGDEIDLFRISIRTWNDLHPLVKVTQPTSLLTAWGEMVRQDEERHRDPEDEYLGNVDRREVQEKVVTAQARYEHRDQPNKKIHKIASPYQRNLYTGTCSRREPLSETQETGSEARVNLVDINAMKVHDKWALLQRFWFKQLHSHHGFIMGKSGTNKRYHRAALSVLTSLAEHASNHELGRTATGLIRPDLLPDFDNEKSFKRWNQQLSTTVMQSATSRRPQTLWPSAFLPGTVGHPAANLQQACYVWQQLGYRNQEINAVHRLAHEVACVMTDPWTCNHVDWSSDDLAKISKAIYEARIKNKRSHTADPKVDDDDRIERAWGSALIFHHYTRWAGSTWADLQKAVKAVPTP